MPEEGFGVKTSSVCARNTHRSERRDPASQLCPGISCTALSKSIPFMGLGSPIF